MKYLVGRDEYELTTGRQFYSNNGIIGLSPDLILSEGLDGSISDQFTSAEKVEIADFMIGKWIEFKGGKHEEV